MTSTTKGYVIANRAFERSFIYKFKFLNSIFLCGQDFCLLLPEWIRWCSFKWPFRLNAKSQSVHANGLSPTNTKPQCQFGRRNCFSSCCELLTSVDPKMFFQMALANESFLTLCTGERSRFFRFYSKWKSILTNWSGLFSVGIIVETLHVTTCLKLMWIQKDESNVVFV